MIGQLIAPLPIVVALLIYACWTVSFSKAQRRAKITVFVATAILIFASSPILSNMLLRPFEEYYPVFLDSITEVDNIVVLGCWNNEDPYRPIVDNVADCSLTRLIEALRLARVYPKATVVVSGGRQKEFHALTHAEYSAMVLIQLGFPKERLYISSGNTNTRDTNHEAKRLQTFLRGKTNLLVSNASHLTRAVKIFNQYEIDVIPVPARYLSGSASNTEVGLFLFIPNSDSLERSKRALYEAMGNIWVYISTRFPSENDR